MLKPLRLLASLGAVLLCTPAAAADGPEVRVRDGALTGLSSDGVDSFRGVPFAAPPVGALRWRAPQPAAPWRDVRAATRNADACMQTPVPGNAAPLTVSVSEDCLYLNVWRPAGVAAGAKLPVLVWIHGGGFVNGGASPAVFEGNAFARQGVIMVGIAYRLGRFGFFAHPALTAAGEDGGLLGNYGYMDQIAALKWVRDNISSFGGDPRRVTIFGESAGGASVHALLTSPLAKGLFAGAIVQSGGGRGALLGARYLDRADGTTPSLESVGLAFAKANGIMDTGPGALAALRALPAAAIDGGLNMRTILAQTSTYGGPVIDGRIVTGAPDRAYAAGTQARVPLMIGATSGDLGLLQAGTKDALFAQFGAQADTLRRAYDPDGTRSLAALVAEIGGDQTMVEPARHTASLFSRRGIPAWHFRFSYVADSVRDRFPAGAPHASDVPFVMGTVRTRYQAATTPRDADMARAMNGYWANFAKTGDPNGKGLPRWPRYDAKADQVMDFSPEGRAEMKPEPRRARLDALAAAAKE